MNMHFPVVAVFAQWYDGDTRSKDMWKQKCKNYIVTNQHAEYLRKRIKVVKK